MEKIVIDQELDLTKPIEDILTRTMAEAVSMIVTCAFAVCFPNEPFRKDCYDVVTLADGETRLFRYKGIILLSLIRVSAFRFRFESPVFKDGKLTIEKEGGVSM